VSRTLVDSNVILDVITSDPKWFEWSARALEESAEISELVINPIIYAEVSIHFARIEDLDEALAAFQRSELPFAAGFLAGKCFIAHKKRGGPRSSAGSQAKVLPFCS